MFSHHFLCLSHKILSVSRMHACAVQNMVPLYPVLYMKELVLWQVHSAFLQEVRQQWEQLVIVCHCWISMLWLYTRWGRYLQSQMHVFMILWRVWCFIFSWNYDESCTFYDWSECKYVICSMCHIYTLNNVIYGFWLLILN